MSKNRANKSGAWLARVPALDPKRVFRYPIWVLILAAPFFTYNADAKAIARFSVKDKLSVTLHDDNCAMKGEVTNLPKRAVWRLDGVDTEGCWGTSEQFGMIFFYFADKTATGIPIPFFEPVNEV